VSANGSLLASAQEGHNSLIRIWDYATARCLSVFTMPVSSLKCLSFSADGNLLASVGKDAHNKEMIIIWDVSKCINGQKPDIVARQTSEWNILSLKFSPVDSTRLVSCGKENIRFWRARE
jgi:WD40 repeat protein